MFDELTSARLDANLQLFAQYLYAYDRYVLIRNQVPSSDRANPDGVPLIYPAGGPFYPTEFAAAHGIRPMQAPRGQAQAFHQLVYFGVALAVAPVEHQWQRDIFLRAKRGDQIE